MSNENETPRDKNLRYLGLIIAIVAIVVTIIIWLWPIPPPPPSDFSISIDPMLGAIQAGGVIQTTVSVMGISGYDHTVSLSATGQPSGVVLTFVPPFGEAKPSYTSSVTINVDKNVPAGDYTLVIKGTGADGKEHSCSYTLTVKPSVTPPRTPAPTTTPSNEAEGGHWQVTIEDAYMITHPMSGYTYLIVDARFCNLAAQPMNISQKEVAVISEDGKIFVACGGGITESLICERCTFSLWVAEDVVVRPSFLFDLGEEDIDQVFKLQFQEVPHIPFSVRR